MRRRAITCVLLGLLLAGCATAYQPPSGVAWGYTGVSASPILHVFGYAASRSLCDYSLSLDRSNRRLQQIGMTFTECRQVVVGLKNTPDEPAGGDTYWVYNIANRNGTHGVGSLDQALCDAGRQHQGTNHQVSRECVQVGVRFLDHPSATQAHVPPLSATPVLAWGFRSTLPETATAEAFTWSPTRQACEVALAASKSMKSSPCEPMTITAATYSLTGQGVATALGAVVGSWWGFTAAGHGHAANSQELCERLRKDSAAASACTPVWVTVGPTR